MRSLKHLTTTSISGRYAVKHDISKEFDAGLLERFDALLTELRNSPSTGGRARLIHRFAANEFLVWEQAEFEYLRSRVIEGDEASLAKFAGRFQAGQTAAEPPRVLSAEREAELRDAFERDLEIARRGGNPSSEYFLAKCESEAGATKEPVSAEREQDSNGGSSLRDSMLFGTLAFLTFVLAALAALQWRNGASSWHVELLLLCALTTAALARCVGVDLWRAIQSDIENQVAQDYSKLTSGAYRGLANDLASGIPPTRDFARFREHVPPADSRDAFGQSKHLSLAVRTSMRWHDREMLRIPGRRRPLLRRYAATLREVDVRSKRLHRLNERKPLGRRRGLRIRWMLTGKSY